MTTIDTPATPMPADQPQETPDSSASTDEGPLAAVGGRHRGPVPRKRFSRAQLEADAVATGPENPSDVERDEVLGEVGILAPDILRVHDLGIEEALLLAAKLKALAPMWAHRDSEDAPLEAGTVQDMHVATALRVTTRRAYLLTMDAHHAVDNLPTCLDLLEQGMFPAAWFLELLRRIRALPADAQHVVDDTIADWDLTGGPEAFTRNLRALVTELTALLKDPHQEARDQRRVELHGASGDDGIACVSIHGPAPEIADYVARIDAAARAAQRAQKDALEHPEVGKGIPFDPNGEVARSKVATTRGQLRYLITTQGALDADGVDVPALRYRINITIPALTLLDMSETPGLVDGITPIPADMARDLAAGSDTWYRILTDPTDGAFLPLAADKYTPTAAMREHLRLRHPVCAAPGCTRPAMSGEIDHVEEYDHQDPASGGLTAVENLHILCTLHHELKTRRHIDPTRIDPTRPSTGHIPSLTPGTGRESGIDTHEQHVDDDIVPAPPPRPPEHDAAPAGTDKDDDNPYTPARLRALRDKHEPVTPRRLTAAQARARRRAEHRVNRARTRYGHTHWYLGPGINTTTDDDLDLLTATTMAGLDDAWTTYLTTRHATLTVAEHAATADDTPPPF